MCRPAAGAASLELVGAIVFEPVRSMAEQLPTASCCDSEDYPEPLVEPARQPAAAVATVRIAPAAVE